MQTSTEKDVTDIMGGPPTVSGVQALETGPGVQFVGSLPADYKLLKWKSGDNDIEVILYKDKVKYKAFKVGTESGHEGDGTIDGSRG